jgi:hypothetical protein
MRAIKIIGRLREKYSNKYTQTPNKDKNHYINWLQDEYAELAMKQANGAEQSSSNCNIPLVSVSDSDIDAMFPYEDIKTARPTRPENRIRAYNSRQADRREGAKRLLEKLHSR